MTKKDLTTLIPVVIFICSIFAALFSFIAKGYSTRLTNLSDAIRDLRRDSYSEFVRYGQYNKGTEDMNTRINQLDKRIFEVLK